MTANVVQAQYEQLDQIAARFAAAAEKEQVLLQKVNRCTDVLRNGAWEGKGIVAFLIEMDGEVMPAHIRLVAALNEASHTTSQVAMLVRQAEVDAASLFQSEGTPASLMGSPNAGQVTGPDQVSRSPSSVPLGNMSDLYKAIEDAKQPITILRIGPGKDGKGEYVVLVQGTVGNPLSGDAWWGDHSNSWWSAVGSGLGLRTVYVDRILECVRGLPEGATIHLAGHSQGGHAIQIAANELGQEGRYTIGSVTGFGTYQLDDRHPGVPAPTIYNAPLDPVHAIDVGRDVVTAGVGGMLLGSVTIPLAGAVYAARSMYLEGQKETVTREWWLGHSDYESSDELRHTSLPFQPCDASLYAQHSATEVNQVQRAVEYAADNVAHTSSTALIYLMPLLSF